jgi:hypothetical protein
MWSTHSRRIDPISRSAKPFCQGEAGAVGLSRMPMAAQSARDDAAIEPVAIADEVVRSLIPGKCLRYLTCNPFCRRICCDVDPDEASAVEPDNDEGIEQVETDSWNNEQVHGGNVRRVVAQEGSPSLAGRRPVCSSTSSRTLPVLEATSATEITERAFAHASLSDRRCRPA